jgi:hypothetical protein
MKEMKMNKKKVRDKKCVEIKVTYLNELENGVLEKVLSDMFVKKIRDGKLNGYAP